MHKLRLSKVRTARLLLHHVAGNLELSRTRTQCRRMQRRLAARRRRLLRLLLQLPHAPAQAVERGERTCALELRAASAEVADGQNSFWEEGGTGRVSGAPILARGQKAAGGPRGRGSSSGARSRAHRIHSSSGRTALLAWPARSTPPRASAAPLAPAAPGEPGVARLRFVPISDTSTGSASPPHGKARARAIVSGCRTNARVSSHGGTRAVHVLAAASSSAAPVAGPARGLGEPKEPRRGGACRVAPLACPCPGAGAAAGAAAHVGGEVGVPSRAAAKAAIAARAARVCGGPSRTRRSASSTRRTGSGGRSSARSSS